MQRTLPQGKEQLQPQRSGPRGQRARCGRGAVQGGQRPPRRSEGTARAPVQQRRAPAGQRPWKGGAEGIQVQQGPLQGRGGSGGHTGIGGHSARRPSYLQPRVAVPAAGEQSPETQRGNRIRRRSVPTRLPQGMPLLELFRACRERPKLRRTTMGPIPFPPPLPAAPRSPRAVPVPVPRRRRSRRSWLSRTSLPRASSRRRYRLPARRSAERTRRCRSAGTATATATATASTAAATTAGSIAERGHRPRAGTRSRTPLAHPAIPPPAEMTENYRARRRPPPRFTFIFIFAFTQHTRSPPLREEFNRN